MNNEIREKIENNEIDEIKNYISLLILKLYKDNKITDIERIAYELKILSLDKYGLYKIYEILKGVEVWKYTF